MANNVDMKDSKGLAHDSHTSWLADTQQIVVSRGMILNVNLHMMKMEDIAVVCGLHLNSIFDVGVFERIIVVFFLDFCEGTNVKMEEKESREICIALHDVLRLSIDKLVGTIIATCGLDFNEEPDTRTEAKARYLIIAAICGVPCTFIDKFVEKITTAIARSLLLARRCGFVWCSTGRSSDGRPATPAGVATPLGDGSEVTRGLYTITGNLHQHLPATQLLSFSEDTVSADARGPNK